MSFTRYADNITSFEVQSYTGAAFYIRSFCDDNDSIYITKAPVCKLSMTPTVQTINTNIAWDISNSRSDTGTIDTFDITWGGTTDIGNLASQDWSSDPKSGNVQYTTVGTYTVQASVTDTLGTSSKTQKITIQIVTFVNLQRAYIGTTNNGLYILTPTSGPTASNTGLTGDNLKFRSVRLHPAYKDLPVGQQHLWATTSAGVVYSTDGGANWSTINKTTLGTPAGTGESDTDNLDQIDLSFDPQDQNRIYLVRSTTDQLWLYWSDDYGASWSNNEVTV